MKKIKIIYIVALFSILVACNDDFLERYPISELSPETYFKSEAELKTYTNGFYSMLPTEFDDANYVYQRFPAYGDEWSKITVPVEFRGTRVVPTSGGNWVWTNLRKINFFLENSDKCSDKNVRATYNGLARFFRAYFYFDKVQLFGDVPWYGKVLEMDDLNLMKARDPRTLVIDSVLNDLDYAIANLSTTKSAQLITKWTALAFKSRVCLFEGTFRKYHGIAGWESLLNECVEASNELMTNSGYGIYTSTPDKAYWELFIPDDAITKEIILARQYSAAVPLVSNLNYYFLSVSFGRPGVLKHIINGYLMADGSRFTDTPGYETMQFYEECQNRDPRLSQTIRTPGYKRIGETKTSVPDFASCITGYQFIKYIQAPAFDQGNCVNDITIFRYAETLLNFAEAKAELGTLAQADIDRSIKLLRDRVGMPNLNVAAANAIPDPYLGNLYRNVTGANKGVILEIRRERTVELIDEGFRWWDLMRWKEGHLLAGVFNGMYFPGIGTYDLDHDGKIDLEIYTGTKPTAVPGRQYQKIGELILENGVAGGKIVLNPTVDKVWTENKDYLYPIPTQERLLNSNLTQNPNWFDGLKK